MNVTIDLASKLIRRDDQRRIERDEITTHSETIYLNAGFRRNSATYYLSEDAEIHTIIDHLSIDYDSLPLFINHEKENLVFLLNQ